MDAPQYLSVTATRAGFRRAGRAWPAAPVIIATADFTAEQLAAIAAEPALLVAPADTPPAPPAPAAPDGASRAARLNAALATLRAAGEAGDWTKSGKPTVDALERASGLTDVTAAERDAAVDAPDR